MTVVHLCHWFEDYGFVFASSLRLGWTTLGGNWMDHTNTQSGHIFKNAVGRKEKLRFLKALSPDLCPAGTLGAVGMLSSLVCQWGHDFKHIYMQVHAHSLQPGCSPCLLVCQAKVRTFPTSKWTCCCFCCAT